MRFVRMALLVVLPLVTLAPEAAAGTERSAAAESLDANDSVTSSQRAIRVARARVSGVGSRAALLAELCAAAGELEAQARIAPDSAEGERLLAQAAMTYYAAAVPVMRDPPDDPLRCCPGSAWPDYLRLAWQLGRERGGPRLRPQFAFLLCPWVIDEAEVVRLGPLYNRAFWEPALDLLSTARESVLRAQAGSYAAAQCLFADWPSACEIAARTYEIEKQARVTRASQIGPLWRAIDRLHRAFAEALWRWERDLDRALILYGKAHGAYPSESQLRDPEWLWEHLRAHLPTAIRSGPWDWRYPDWLDLHSNRLRTVPGLRLRSIHWIDASEEVDSLERTGMVDGNRRPVLDFEQRFWDGYVTGSDAPRPWSVRRARRRALLVHN